MRKSAISMVVLAAVSAAAACGSPQGSAAKQAPDVALDVPRLDAGTVAPAPLSPPSGIHFGREPARVGERSHTTVSARSTWVDPASGPPAQVSTYESEFIVEVLAVQGPAPSRVRITFEKNITFDNVTSGPTSIDHRTYVVDVAPPPVLDAVTNTPPSADQIARVLDVLPDLGTRPQIDQALPDGVMQIGEGRDAIALAITRILHPRYWTLDHGTAVLERAAAGEADFAIAIDASSSASGMRMDVKGTARIRVRDARLDSLALEGSFVRPNGEKGQLEITRAVKDLR